MRTQRTRFSLAGLICASLAAPGLSLISTLTIGGVAALAASPGGWAEGPGVFGLLGGFLMVLVIVTLWGLVPALIFGGTGALLAGRFLPLRLVWRWGLAGAASATAYVFVAFGVSFLDRNLAFWIAPWFTLLELGQSRYDQSAVGLPNDPMPFVIVSAILLAGGIAGLIYRAALKNTSVIDLTSSPLVADLSLDPELSEPRRHEEG